MEAQGLSDECSLIRMVWFPRCFDGEELTGACFSSGELVAELRNGNESFISVDCEAEILQDVVISLIRIQGRPELIEQDGRREARFIRLLCGEVRQIDEMDGVGIKPFIVERDPTQEDLNRNLLANPAHCAIKNTSPRCRGITRSDKKKYVDYLRTQLLKIVRAKLTFDELFPKQDFEDGQV